MAETEPKLFRKARRPSAAATWKFASAALSVLTLAAGAFGYMQYDTVRTLRAQLSAATAEAHRAAAEGNDIRAQLAAAQDRINSQGTKLTVAQQQASTEQQQLDDAQQQATAEHQQLQQQLAATKRQIEAEKRELQEARTQLAAESRPDLPVRVVFFNAARPGAKVAVLQNLSNAELDVTLDVQSPGSKAHIRKQLVLAARGALRMGPAQGLPLTPGQVITLDNAKFRRIVQTVS